MTRTSGESFPAALHMLNLDNGGNDAYVRDYCKNKSSQDNAAAVDKTPFFICMIVNTGEPHDSRNITEKVIYNIRTTEREREGVDSMEDCIESPTNPGSGNQLPAEFSVRCDFIKKGPVDGHTTVIGHGCKQEALSACQGEK